MAKSAKKPETARRQRPDSGARPLPAVNRRKATTKPTTGAAALPGPAARASANGGTADPNEAAPVPSNRACWRCYDLPQAQRSRR